MRTKVIIAAAAGLLAIAAVKHHSGEKTCPLKAAFSKETEK